MTILLSLSETAIFDLCRKSNVLIKSELSWSSYDSLNPKCGIEVAVQLDFKVEVTSDFI